MKKGKIDGCTIDKTQRSNIPWKLVSKNQTFFKYRISNLNATS